MSNKPPRQPDKAGQDTRAPAAGNAAERNRWRALSPTEYDRPDGEKGTFWTPVGRAFENKPRNGKSAITLHITPHIAVTGKIVLMPIGEDETDDAEPAIRRFTMDHESTDKELF